MEEEEELSPRDRAFYKGLLGFGAGILANNAPTRYPGGGMQALGQGIQQGINVYDQALTMEDKLEALRQERALKGQLEDRLPTMIDQATEMGVDKNITDNATLMMSINPSLVYNTLSNAMVKAQKRARPELTGEQLIYTDPISKRQFRYREDGYLGEEIKGLPEEKVKSSPISMSRGDAMRSPSLSIYSNQMGPNDILQIEPGKLPSILRGPEAKTTPGRVQSLSDEEKQRFQSTDIASKIINPETGQTTFYNSLGKQITEMPEEKSSPFTLTREEATRSNYYTDYVRTMGPNDILEIEPGKRPSILRAPEAKMTPGEVQPLSDEEKQKFQGTDIASKIINPETGQTTFYNILGKQVTEMPEEKSLPFTLTKSEVARSTDYADFGQVMGDNDILQVSPDGTTQIIEAKKAKEVKEESQFSYYTKSTLPKGFESFSSNMGEGDVLKVKDGDASVVRKPVAKGDPEKLEFRTKIVKGKDGKLYEQTGYFDKKSGVMESDFGRIPVKVEGALTQKQKIDLVNETLKKPNQRIDSMVVQFDSIATAVGAGESFDDLALIFYIAKMLDPTSVVREGEQLTIRNTGSLGDQMVAWINKVNSGAPFSKKQRNSIINFAERKIDTELNNYQRAVTKARSQAGKLKIDKDTVEGALGIVHEKYDTKTVADKVRTTIDLLPDVGGGNNKTNNPIKENSPQASATKKVVESVKSAFTSESPPINIEDDEELESILK